MFGSADIAVWLRSEVLRRLPPGRSRPDIGALVGIDPETGSDGLEQCLDNRDFFTDEAILQSSFHSGRMPGFYVRQHRLVLGWLPSFA
jgi:hypothetical protein